MEDPTDIDSLVSQLQGVTRVANNQEKVLQQVPITKENLEEFIITQASQLIQNTNSTIEIVKSVVEAAPDNKEISALAELIQSSTSALDTLSKLVISQNKNNTMKEIKKLDIANKTAAVEQKKVTYTREEIFKKLFENDPKDVVEIKD